MSEKYPCETCAYYRATNRCDNPMVQLPFASNARKTGRFINDGLKGCGNGRRHSGYVSVWRRVWAGFWSALTKSPVKMPQAKPVEPKYEGFNFEDRKPQSLFSPAPEYKGEPVETGRWR